MKPDDKNSGHLEKDHSGKNKNGHPNQSQDPKLTSAQRKWVINLSSTPLTQLHRKNLAHGPKFVVAPKTTYREYITAIEPAHRSLNTTKAEELRADIYRIFRQSHHPKHNLSKDELKMFKQLKTDKDHIILTIDKGVALVVMDKQDYIKKARNL